MGRRHQRPQELDRPPETRLRPKAADSRRIGFALRLQHHRTSKRKDPGALATV